MKKFLCSGAALRSLAVAVALFGASAVSGTAFAQDETPTGATSDFEITGSAGVYSQYRFRGISLSDEDVAFQGSIGVAHSSGFYVGTWGSNLAGFGTFGGSNVEIDIYGGYAGEAGGIGYDVSVLWYTYPGTNDTDYVEFIGKLSKEVGPVGATVGVGFVPDQSSVGSESNLYLFGDLASGIPNTPVTLKAHLGYSDGDGSLSPGGNYLEWSLGADIAIDKLTLGVSYVDTDIGSATAFGLDPARNIADSAVVVSLGVSF